MTLFSQAEFRAPFLSCDHPRELLADTIELHPQDFIGNDISLLRKIVDPNTNTILVNRHVSADLTAFVRRFEESTLVPQIPHSPAPSHTFTFANGQKLKWFIPKQIEAIKGKELLFADITDVCDQMCAANPNALFVKDLPNLIRINEFSDSKIHSDGSDKNREGRATPFAMLINYTPPFTRFVAAKDYLQIAKHSKELFYASQSSTCARKLSVYHAMGIALEGYQKWEELPAFGIGLIASRYVKETVAGETHVTSIHDSPMRREKRGNRLTVVVRGHIPFVR